MSFNFRVDGVVPNVVDEDVSDYYCPWQNLESNKYFVRTQEGHYLRDETRCIENRTLRCHCSKFAFNDKLLRFAFCDSQQKIYYYSNKIAACASHSTVQLVVWYATKERMIRGLLQWRRQRIDRKWEGGKRTKETEIKERRSHWTGVSMCSEYRNSLYSEPKETTVGESLWGFIMAELWF